MKPLILTFIALTCLASTAVRGETRVTFNASGIAQVNGEPFNRRRYAFKRTRT